MTASKVQIPVPEIQKSSSSNMKRAKLFGYTFFRWEGNMTRWVKFKSKDSPTEVAEFLKLSRLDFSKLKNRLWEEHLAKSAT